uniref:Uncharacterized protein n=1 Tax=Rhizophora mucronata TaxID=61149 RepID=A0A2P2MJE8_RHIMU
MCTKMHTRFLGFTFNESLTYVYKYQRLRWQVLEIPKLDLYIEVFLFFFFF